jgi:hypothetical protein
LRISRPSLKSAVAAVAAIAMFAVANVSPAMAEEVEATFSGSKMKITTSSISVKLGTGEPVSCTLNKGKAEGPASNGFTVWNESFRTKFSCPGGTTLETKLTGVTWYDTVAAKYIAYMEPEFGGFSESSPFGTYGQDGEPIATYVNGSGATASTLSLTNATIGHRLSDGKAITISGTFNSTTPTGGLLTLSH